MGWWDTAQKAFIDLFLFGFQIEELSQWQRDNNPHFNPNSAFMATLVIIHLIVGYNSAFLLAIGAVHISDVFLLLFWVAQIINNALNRALAAWVQQTKTAPYVGTLKHDNPSYVLQNVMFFYTVIALFPLIYRRYSTTTFLFLITLYPILVPMAQIGLFYDSHTVVLTTSLLAMGWAGLTHFVLAQWVYPWGRAWVASMKRWAKHTRSKKIQWALATMTPADAWTEPGGMNIIFDEVIGPDDPWAPPSAVDYGYSAWSPSIRSRPASEAAFRKFLKAEEAAHPGQPPAASRP